LYTTIAHGSYVSFTYTRLIQFFSLIKLSSYFATHWGTIIGQHETSEMMGSEIPCNTFI